MNSRTETEQPAGDVDRCCKECDLVVYDIPISGEEGTGYLNPDYCPKCGKPLHPDWVECEGCGDVIDFKKATSYHKTSNDERFWHDDCVPDLQPVTREVGLDE